MKKSKIRVALVAVLLAVVASLGFIQLSGTAALASTCEHYCQEAYDECILLSPEFICQWRLDRCLANCP